MAYKDAIVYFYTGTGNSYRVATWVGETAHERGVAATVLPIDAARPSQEVGEGPEHLLGLVMPTHGFTAPWRVLRFAWQLPRRQGTQAVVLASRAGTKFGRVFLPGLEGTAVYLVALLLWLKGYSLRGAAGIDMPSNWTALHPGFSRAASQAIIDRAAPRVRRIMDAVLAGRRSLGGWIELLCGLLLLPISCGYMLIGRFFLAKLFFATDACTGCSICAANCPNTAIRMYGKPSRPYWTLRCESCMRCMNYCPVHAVEASQPLAVLFYYVTSVPVALYLLNWLGGKAPWLAGIQHSWAVWLLQYPYTLLAIFLTYAAFIWLIRVPAINRLFTLATLTHYYRRYREPGATLKEIAARKR